MERPIEVGLHCHGMLEILVCRGVKGCVTVDGHRIPLAPDPVIVIPPLAVHSARIHRGAGHILVFQTSPEALKPAFDSDALLESAGFDWQDLAGRTLPEQGIRRILAAAERTPPDSQSGSVALCARIMEILLLNRPNGGAPVPETRRLRGIIRWTEKNMANPISLDDAANASGLDPAYFCRYFKSVSGQTWGQYLRSLRLERAVSLLREGRSVTDSCSGSGCGNLSHFIRSFRTAFGLTPLRYRNRILRKN